MADDIVDQLLNIGDELSSDYYPTIYDAAAVIARLRAAGDALADSYNSVWIGIGHFDQLFIDKWEEARRG